ncbi:MAG: aspartyl protease family protein [Candidatus Eisenbacteria bacterium]|nr:aspartyl protease family protein [Candidatus Eisenbacteria bacterium]
MPVSSRRARSIAGALVLLTAILRSSSPARAAISPQAQAVVDRYVEATGGRAALDGETRTYARGRMETMDLKGSYEQWTEAPNRLASRIHLGSLRIRTGYDGRTGWETDLASKRVRILEGKELEQIESEAWFANEMWARDGQGGGKVQFGTASFRNGEVFSSLEITPPVGSPRRLVFSDKTGLIVRESMRADQHETDIWLSEYRTLGRRKRATLQDGLDQEFAFFYDDVPANRVRIDSLIANGPVDSATFAPPASQDDGVAWLGTPGLAHVPFRYGTRHVWIKVSINGLPPADFILDTGASGTAIDRDYANRIGLKHEGRFGIQGMGGGDEGAFTRVATLRVGGLKGGIAVADLKASIVNLGEGADQVTWRHMDGLLGADVLSRFAVEIDYDRQIVTFHDAKTFAYQGHGSALDLEFLSGIPIVHADVESGCGGRFLVDVGSGFGLLVHGSLVKQCRVFSKVEGRKQVKIMGGGIGSGFASWLCRLDTLGLGPFRIPEPIAGLSLSTHGMVGSEDYAGNLGNAVLERFTCTFDYANRKLWLEPAARFAQRDRYSRVGALFIRSQSRVTACAIVHGSPADDAGLKTDDEVLSIDGRPAARFTPEEMDRLFVNGEPGTTHTLTIAREGRTSTITLKLEDVI